MSAQCNECGEDIAYDEGGWPSCPACNDGALSASFGSSETASWDDEWVSVEGAGAAVDGAELAATRPNLCACGHAHGDYCGDELCDERESSGKSNSQCERCWGTGVGVGQRLCPDCKGSGDA